MLFLLKFLQDGHEQVHSIVFISFHQEYILIEELNLRTDEKDIHGWNRSEKNHDNNQLGGWASPMYLDKYYFPFLFYYF